MLLAVALLISTCASAKMELSVKGHCGEHVFDKTVYLEDDQNYIEYKHESGLVVRTEVYPSEETITYVCKVVQVDEDGNEVVLNQSQMVAEWGKPATIAMGQTGGRDVSLTVVANR